MELPFRLANFIAMLGWIALILAPGHRITKMIVRSGAISVAFGVLYIALFAVTPGFSFSDFQSMAGVQHLFQTPGFLLAGWVHYLAFDLLVGSWMVGDAEKRNLKHVYLLPSLVLTFMFGPVGFVSYLILRKCLCK